jgi:D-alanine-D-alanine ligase
VSQPAVIFGGPSPEHDVSIILGLPAARTLADAGHDVSAIYWTKTSEFYVVDVNLEARDFLDGVPKKSRQVVLGSSGFEGKRAPSPSVVVNCCHGGPGEDGTLQAALDLAGIPYTGPSAAGAAIGMDKLAFGGVVQSAGLPCLPRALVADEGGAAPFDGPYIVKPRSGGSSIGIELASDWATAQALVKSSVHLRAGAVIEPYRPESVDLNVAMRNYPELQLSAIEQPLRSAGRSEILGYADKYLSGQGMETAARQLPADIPSEIEKQLRAAASAVAGLVGLRGVARLDFLYQHGELLVNEINTIPGSMAKYLWIDPVVPFRQLLEDMMTEATARPARFWNTTGADGSALRAAGSIAGKLG